MGKKSKYSQRRRKKTTKTGNNREGSGYQQIFEQAVNLHLAGHPREAAALYRKVLTLKPDFPEAYYNLGNALFDQGRLDEAADCFVKATTNKPDYAEAHYNLGVVLQDLDRLDESTSSYQQAVKFKPDYAEAHHNLGTIFFNQGKLEEAVRSMQIAVENAPGNILFSDDFIVLLNDFMPTGAIDSVYIQAQRSLQQVSKGYGGTHLITDETVRRIYQKCNDILIRHKLVVHTNKTQLYRGSIGQDNCPRHKMVFNRFNIIPEYCFSCYKVAFEPRTVLELFKLLFVFEKIKLPGDNSRKCIVEVRPDIPGTYKGFIYCKSMDEGKEILDIVRPMVEEEISKGIPALIKRGCSEFQLKYPQYGSVDNKTQQMSYNEEWRRYEAYADKDMKNESFENPHNFSHNHPGFTLLDILVMNNWLAYAAERGDSSYLKIVN